MTGKPDTTPGTSPGLASPGDVLQALMDAQAGLSDDDAAPFRAKLILLPADRGADDEAVMAAIGMAREGLGEGTTD